MKAVIQTYKTGELKLIEAPPPQLKDGHVLVRTTHSLISVGTEKTKIDTAKKSLIGKARARPDLVKQVINRAKQEGLWKTWQTVSDRLTTPTALGYSSAGIVMETLGDVGGIRPGDRVACGGDTANHAEIVCVPKNLVVPIPHQVGSDHAAFATVGAIAMQGVRQADARVGEKVAVIGLGLVGLLTVQILKAAGCQVFGQDVDYNKTSIAKQLGCDDAALATDDDLEERILLFTHGYGMDATIITAGTSSNQPIEQAGDITREKGRIVVVGAAKMDIPREPFYMKELDIRMSRSYGPGRYDTSFEDEGRDYPYAYVRFTERRNMHSFLELVSNGSVQLGPMITHRFPIEDVTQAYELIQGERRANYLGILLEYGRDVSDMPRRVKVQSTPITSQKIRLGVIGAGKYATANLLPYLRRQPLIVLGSICTSTGLTAIHAAEKFGFQSADADIDTVLAESDAVLIATRHNDHASYAVKALERGKPVFVEKPLAINQQQLNDVMCAASGGDTVMVGFNRRFAPAVQAVLEHLQSSQGPRQLLMRVNAGSIPMDHWIQDPTVGGGRLIGEACHFVDLAVYLCGAKVRSVHAVAIPQAERSHLLWDNFSINLHMSNGAVATVVYTSVGDPVLPKEYLEIFAGGRVGIIHDYKRAELWAHGKQKRHRWVKQDKGQQRQIEAWIKGLRAGTSPISFDEISNVHQACLAAVDSLKTGDAVKL
jgi:predicted dehydrogenase/threonine dehydrogenase-like Zn-dependent dehydrogenase